MKTLSTLSLFIFWAVVVSVLTAGIISYDKNKGSNQKAGDTQVNLGASDIIKGSINLNMAEVAKHNSPSDCWMVINNKVYNVTKSISSHPGGAWEIIKFCGQEATVEFNTKDMGSGGQPHSGGANRDLSNFYIGDLNQTITGKQVEQNIQKTNSVIPTRRGDDGEDDD